MSDARERLNRVRQQQAGVTMTPAEAAAAVLAHIQPHEDHPWRQVGRCVYCGPCHVRPVAMADTECGWVVSAEVEDAGAWSTAPETLP